MWIFGLIPNEGSGIIWDLCFGTDQGSTGRARGDILCWSSWILSDTSFLSGFRGCLLKVNPSDITVSSFLGHVVLEYENYCAIFPGEQKKWFCEKETSILGFKLSITT